MKTYPSKCEQIENDAREDRRLMAQGIQFGTAVGGLVISIGVTMTSLICGIPLLAIFTMQIAAAAVALMNNDNL